jgi:site-specific DNA-methyltransferase (adenine-specific)
MTAPYYQDDLVQLWCGDFRDILPTLTLEADLILTDPPYGETSLDWDVWPAGWPSFMTGYASSMWCFGSMRMFLDRRDEFADWRLSQDVVWEKHNGSGFASDRFKRVHEHAIHWYRGDWSSVIHVTPRLPGGSGAKSVRKRGITPHTGVIGDTGYVDDGLRLIRSVVYCQSMQQRAINETEKPTGLLEPLISYACPPGGVVLDPFAGSCSTLVAARSLGRRAVGVEKRESQCEAAARRLAQGCLDLSGSSS